MVILTNFNRLKEKEKFSQKKTIQYMKEKILKKIPEEKKKELEEIIDKYIVDETKIKERALFDYTPENNKIKLKNAETTSLDLERIALSDKIILECLEENYQKNNKIPDEIIFASTTETSLPSPAQVYVSQNNWKDTSVFHSQYFGCMGAFPAVKIANNSIIANPEKKVDILNIEIISTYLEMSIEKLQKKLDPLELIKSTLFGDGAIMYSAMSKKNFNKNDKKGLEIMSNHSRIIPGTIGIVKFFPVHTEFSLEMSKDLPYIIERNLLDFTNELCSKANIDFQKEKKDLVYAIHPGGPKILQKIKEQYEIDEKKFENSYNLIYNNGNPSSTSCPILWKEIIKNENIKDNQKIITMGFGPGLTLEGMILKKIKPN